MQNNLNLSVNPLNLNFMQQIMELNQKTLKKLSYLESQELIKICGSKALLEKNMGIFIDNSHTSLDYLYQLFNILENSWVNLFKEAGGKTKDIMQHTKSSATSAVNKMSRPQSKTAHSHSVSHSSSKRTSRSRLKTSAANAAKRDESPKSATSASSGQKNVTQKTEEG